MDIAALPKTELHLHLDCSLSYDLIHRLNPEVDRATFLRDVALPEKCSDLADFLRRVPNQMNLMQTEDALRATVTDLFTQLQADNVIYAEIRFAPHQHQQQGLSPEDVVRIVNEAFDLESANTGIESRLILCTLRHFTAEAAMETAKLVHLFQGTRVAALDLAADEAGFPIEPQVAAFRYAREHGLFRTAHAGEAKGPESVWETLDRLAPIRIGHGVRSIEDPRLVNHLAENNIHLEVCPACNVMIDVYDRLEDHPIDKLYRAGVPLSINTDGRTLPLITQNLQYQMLADTFGWGDTEFLACARNALKAAFLPDNIRQSLMNRLNQYHVR
ncbi:MAG: adenosine deaminase [Acidobacteriota bacterium]|nr:adenosine deaminase [Acidobacteriota bacterium]